MHDILQISTTCSSITCFSVCVIFFPKAMIKEILNFLYLNSYYFLNGGKHLEKFSGAARFVLKKNTVFIFKIFCGRTNIQDGLFRSVGFSTVA